MEYAHQTLMSIVTEYRRTGQRLKEDVLKRIIYKFIPSFAEMETMKIYHQDIKPHNLLVTANIVIKIIDFSISEINNSILK